MLGKIAMAQIRSGGVISGWRTTDSICSGGMIIKEVLKKEQNSILAYTGH